METPSRFRPDYAGPVYPYYHTGPHPEQVYHEIIGDNPGGPREYLPVYWSVLAHMARPSDWKSLQDWLDGLPPEGHYWTIATGANALNKVRLPKDTLVYHASGAIAERQPCHQFIPIPLANDRVPKSAEVKAVTLLASFVGAVNTHPIRGKMAKAFAGRDDCLIDTCEWSANVTEDRFERFRDATERSVFCLAPRGHGPTSARIIEALELGAIPVYIHDGFEWLPWEREIDWASFCVLCHERDIENLPKRLEQIDLNQTGKAMLRAGKKFLESHFTMKAVAEKIKAEVVDPPATTGLVHALALSHKDFPAALPWAKWVQALGNVQSEALVVSVTSIAKRKHRDELAITLNALRRAFGEVVVLEMEDSGWGHPEGPNRLFVQVMRRASEYGRPILWHEIDNIPLTPQWSQALLAAYDRCGKPIYGPTTRCIRGGDHSIEFCNGTAIYPPDWENRWPGLASPPAHMSFDWHAAPETTPDWFRSETTWVHCSDPGYLNTESDFDRVVPKDCVMFHRDKTCRVIQLANRRLRITIPAELEGVVRYYMVRGNSSYLPKDGITWLPLVAAGGVRKGIIRADSIALQREISIGGGAEIGEEDYQKYLDRC